jgi:DNA-binding transcriptional LysR family regulator
MFVAAASVVAGTDLLSGMPLRVVNVFQPSFPLQALRGPGPQLPFALSLHWHDRTAADRTVQAFRAIVKGAFEQRGSEP